MSWVVSTMRLKLIAKNTVGGRSSLSSLMTNARRRDLGFDRFLCRCVAKATAAILHTSGFAGVISLACSFAKKWRKVIGLAVKLTTYTCGDGSFATPG